MGFPTQYGPVRSDRKPGAHLVPHETLRDTVVILLMIAIMWFLSALGPPSLGHPANPTSQPFTMPDWYLLWTFGLVKVSVIFPVWQINLSFIGLGVVTLEPGFWAAILTGGPIIALFALPFIDAGFESRPAKAAVRSAIGVAGLLWVFGASLVSIDTNVDQFYSTVSGGQSLGQLWLRLWFILPPVLGGLATYVALRRLAFMPMRRTNIYMAALGLGVFGIYTALTFGAWPLISGERAIWALPLAAEAWLAALLGLLGALSALIFYAVTYLDEHRAKQFLIVSMSLVVFVISGLIFYGLSNDRASIGPALQTLAVHSQWLVGFPLFALFAAYFGLRTPYSDYEYKLNECYQCGRCHLVCPITKADADALGGLNLVYNVYKKQHDGVPMWACLTCDACSAVCPLDINYSVYVLTERARTMRAGANMGEYLAKARANAGTGTLARPRVTAADGGQEENPHG